jgi:pyrroline-5-carboxylate reductase
MTTVLLAGCGNMGFAMLKGWLDKGAVQPGDVAVVEPNVALRERAAALGVAVAAQADGHANRRFTLLLVALKPQVLRSALPAYQPFIDTGSTVLTVAAGAAMASYEAIFGAGTPVIRTIPNTPAAIGAGMIGLVKNTAVSKEANAFARRLLEANGVVDEVADEAMIDVVTAVSGSGPAYLFHFIEALAEAAQAAGMGPEQAMAHARQTVFGAARLAEQAEEDAAQLRRNVTSPNGTTFAALKVLMGENLAPGGPLAEIMTRAVAAAKARAEELGQG